MDVILDTNIIAADFSLRKNRFANLFDYLKRTSSNMVVCKVVWDEIRVKYLEKIKGDVARVSSAWQELSKTQMTVARKPDMPDPERELEYFLDRIKNPGKGVRIVFYTDYSRIDVDEIVRRGVNRIRPASDTGEELRDVILWLHALDYAKQKSRSIAFISHDKRFSEETEAENDVRTKKTAQRPEEIEDDPNTHKEYKLHRDLADDASKSGVGVKFYRSLAAFNKLNTLDDFSATLDWLKEKGVLEKVNSSIGGQITTLLTEDQRYVERIREVQLSKLEFADGSIYKVSDLTHFAELRFKVALTVTTEPLTSTYQVEQPDTNFAANRAFSRIAGNVVARWNEMPSGVVTLNNVGTKFSLWSPAGSQVRRRTLWAAVVISLRVEANSVGEIEIESLEFDPSDDPLLQYYVISTSGNLSESTYFIK